MLKEISIFQALNEEDLKALKKILKSLNSKKEIQFFQKVKIQTGFILF
jgi:hypothetical protein